MWRRQRNRTSQFDHPIPPAGVTHDISDVDLPNPDGASPLSLRQTLDLFKQPVLFAWPLCGIGLLAIIWFSTWLRIQANYETASRAAYEDAAFVAKGYARQLSLTLGQLDQVLQSLLFVQEESELRFRLEGTPTKSPFRESQKYVVSIFDETGALVSRSGRSGSEVASRSFEAANVRSRADFKAHSVNPLPTLLIFKPLPQRATGETVISLSRRVNYRDGGFAGMISVAVDPHYLASGYEQRGSRPGDYLSISTQDGSMIVATLGGVVVPRLQLFSTPPTLAGTSVTTHYGAERFTDRQARIMSWYAVEGFPLYAVAGLSEKDVYASHLDSARESVVYAIIASVICTLGAVFGGWQTIHALRRREQRRVTRQSYQDAISGSKEGYFSLWAVRDRAGEIIDFVLDECNEQGAKLIGYDRNAVLGRGFTQILSAKRAQKFLTICRNAMATGLYEDEFHTYAKDGHKEFWGSRRIVRTMAGLAITIRDITETKQHLLQVTSLINLDSLTGLPNRHWLMTHLPDLIVRSQQAGDVIALFCLEIDDFKDFNNTVGHDLGDNLIKGVANRLTGMMRPSDRVVRMGGNEFLLLILHAGNTEAMTHLASRLIGSFIQSFDLGKGNDQAISASIGISSFPRDGDCAELLIKHAGIALDDARKSGKARYRFYQQELFDRLSSRRANESALRSALVNGDFLMHYQPRIDAASGLLVGMEALVRWNDPLKGLIAPLNFIGLAEETGLILRLGTLVIDQTCLQIAQWQKMGLPMVPVSINVSPRQFSDGAVADTIARAMAMHEVPANLIEIEITESCMLGNEKPVAAELAAMQSLGLKLLLDDFGTGYSSLSQLQRLDLDVLKIDRAFTANMVAGTGGEVLIRAIISMAHALDMTVVAEGVETFEQMAILQNLGCDELQGFLISQPVAASQMAQLMTKRQLMPTATTIAC
ncbi:MAG: EAL domain-containing protein [Pseudomonadota bacterium]